MRCPICDFDSTELNIHLRFHVEMDFMDNNENLTQTQKDDHRYEIPIIIVFHMWYYGQDNIQTQRSYLLQTMQR